MSDEISNKWVILGAIIIIGALGFIFFKPSVTENAGGSDGLSGNLVAFSGGAMPSAPCHFMAGEWMGKCTLREIEFKAWSYDWSEPTITVKTGELVRIKATSTDVAHGIAIPAIDFNMRIDPGKTTVGEFMAPEPGTYDYGCSVNCGPGHHDHKGKLVVLA